MNDAESMSELEAFIESAISAIPDADELPVLVIGTKSDLASGEVDESEARAHFEGKGYMFHVVSAKEGTGVEEAFDELNQKLTEE